MKPKWYSEKDDIKPECTKTAKRINLMFRIL